MEDILEIYERPLTYKEPVVCLDEKPIQLLKNVSPTSRVPVPGHIGRKDYEYKRKGTACAFCAVEPLRGKHFVSVTKTRKAHDFATFLHEISLSYPNAVKIHLVMDNLNTHRLKSLTTRFGTKRGKKLWARFEVHYTPKHASWLNQAETQISMYSRECLGRDRIASMATLKKRSSTWARRATDDRRVINWKFTRVKARKTFDYEMTQ